MKARDTRIALLTLAAVLTAGAPLASSHADDKTSRAAAALIERGRYLVTTSGCHDCHTPAKPGPNGAEPDMSRMLSGHPEDLAMTPAPEFPDGPWAVAVAATSTAWSGPWGVSFTANLTPDPDTGLGRWTVRNFKDTIRSGRHLGRGRPILPPMPIPMYKHMTDADLEAIFAFLQSIPPIENRVPEPLPPTETTAATRLEP
jgi:mono/diheme cytochrome c family protein